MAHFVQCTISEVAYRGKAVENHAVNVDLCKSIRKSRFAWYPDNTGLPALKFEGCNVEWVFNTMDQRDAELSRLTADQQISKTEG